MTDLLTPKKRTAKKTIYDTGYGKAVEVWNNDETEEEENNEDIQAMWQEELRKERDRV